VRLIPDRRCAGDGRVGGVGRSAGSERIADLDGVLAAAGIVGLVGGAYSEGVTVLCRVGDVQGPATEECICQPIGMAEIGFATSEGELVEAVERDPVPGIRIGVLHLFAHGDDVDIAIAADAAAEWVRGVGHCMRPGIGGPERQAVGETLFEFGLQTVVLGDACVQEIR